MLQAAQAVCLTMDQLDVPHLKAMIEFYPGRPRDEILLLFNDWVRTEQGKGKMAPVTDPAALFMGWLKRSTWLAKPAAGRA